MPIYEYECSICHSRFEQRESFNGNQETICPICKGRARRLFQPVPIFFKGSGFYVTDHGRGFSPAASTATKTETEVKNKGNGRNGGNGKSNLSEKK